MGCAVCFKNRWDVHKSELNNNIHHSIYLQRAWDKYGKEKFKFIILEIVEDKEKLLDREQHWLDKTKCCKREIGYNLNQTAGSNLGMKHTEKTKKKMSLAHVGKKHTKESKKKMSDTLKKLYENGYVNPMLGKIGKESFHYGKKHTKESKKKMSDAQKKLYENGYKNSMLGKIGKKSPRYGQKHTEESKLKMSNSQKRLFESGYVSPMLGKHHSEETKQKMSKVAGKLTEQQVRIIKWLLKNSDMLQREIGKVFNVTVPTIGRIKRGKTWKHI